MGGQRIDDHSSWIGKAPKGEVFPDKCKTRYYSKKNGAGALDSYQDTVEAIDRTEKKSVEKVKSYKTKEGYRN